MVDADRVVSIEVPFDFANISIAYLNRMFFFQDEVEAWNLQVYSRVYRYIHCVFRLYIFQCKLEIRRLQVYSLCTNIINYNYNKYN